MVFELIIHGINLINNERSSSGPQAHERSEFYGIVYVCVVICQDQYIDGLKIFQQFLTSGLWPIDTVNFRS